MRVSEGERLSTYKDLRMVLTHVFFFQIFMQADFSLEDPPTFQEVLPLSLLLPLGRKRPAETQQDTLSSKLLHEKVGRLALPDHCTPRSSSL